MTTKGAARFTQLTPNNTDVCDECKQRLSAHGSWPALQCPLVLEPSDKTIKILCDALYFTVRRFREDPTLSNMKAVVDASHRIEEVAFKPVIFKEQLAVQITNNKVSWLTPAAVAEFKQSQLGTNQAEPDRERDKLAKLHNR